MFILIPSLCSNSFSRREATNEGFIAFGLTQQGLQPTTYHTQGKQNFDQVS
jgi:hypothetical protein